MSSMNSGNAPLYYQRSMAGDLYAYALGSTYQGYRVWDPDFALSRDPDIFEKVRRDPVVYHALEMRLHQIAGKLWRMESTGQNPADKLVAKIFEEMIEGIDKFTESRYELSQAILVARTFSYIEGDRRTVSLAGLPPQKFWMPMRLKDIDRRRWRLMPRWSGSGQERKLETFWELYSVERRQWEEVEHPEWFVKHVYGDEEARLGYGRGLLEAIYFYWWAKGVVLREGLEGIERWAQGIVTAKIDGLREGSTDRTNDDVRDQWLDIIKKMRSRHALVYGKDDEFNVVETSGTGHQMVIEFLKYLDDGMTQLILGSVLPTGGNQKEGSFARAKVESESTEILIQYDRTLLDESLNRDLVSQLWRLNYPQLCMLGLGGAKRPRLKTVQERREDPHLSIQVIARALASQIPLRRDEVYQKIGFTMPNADDDVIQGTSFGMMPGGGGEGLDNKAADEHSRDESGHFAPQGQGFVGASGRVEGGGILDKDHQEKGLPGMPG